VKRLGVALAIALLAGAGQAHDSWIVPAPSGLSLATGNRYPRAELAVPPASIAQAACRDAAGRPAPFGRTSGALGCWAELHEFEVELDATQVRAYLHEARPQASVAGRWHALQADGIGWRERYRKFARIEVAGPEVPAAVLRTLRRPAGLALEIVPAADTALRAGQPSRFLVLSGGRPVRGLSVELVSERSPLGVWSRTDEEGSVQWPLPFGGRWLVRAIAIDADGPMAWRSRFATLAFEAH
jgi:hypothetical protein